MMSSPYPGNCGPGLGFREYIFSHDFEAMRGYHYLMHISWMVNEMAFHSIYLTEHLKAVGFRAFIYILKTALINRELDKERLSRLRESPGQLRLVLEDDWRTSRLAV